MKNIIQLLFFFCIINYNNSLAQTITWSKYYDVSVDGEFANFMDTLGSGYLFGSNIFCSGTSWNGCLYLGQLNAYGNVVKDTFYNKDEKLITFGISSYKNYIRKYKTGFLLPGISWKENDEIKYLPTLGIYDSELGMKYYNTYPSKDTNENIQMQSLQEISNTKYILTTTVFNKQDSGEIKIVLIKLDDTLGQVSQVKLNGMEEFRQLSYPNCIALKDGNFACSCMGVKYSKLNYLDTFQIVVFKFDTLGHLIWYKNASDFDSGYKYNFITDLTELSNGNIVFNGVSFLDPSVLIPGIGWFSSTTYIQCVNTNGDSLWRKDFTRPYPCYTNSLEALPNGGFIGCGQRECEDCYPTGASGEASWLFKMSSDGEVLWERVYGDTTSELSTANPLYKLTICKDGGLLVSGIGSLGFGKDIKIMKLDSMGCLTPDCAGNYIYTSTIDVKPPWSDQKEVFFRIYPNPVHNILTVDFFSPQPGRKMELLLSDMQGILIQKQSLPNDKHQEQIDVSGLKPGSYTISLLMNGKIIQSEVVVKE